MSRETTDTTAPFIAESTKVRLDLKTIGWLVGTVAAGAIAWGLTTTRVSEHEKRLNTVETDSRTTREVLIRIDERTAEIKRRLDAAKVSP